MVYSSGILYGLLYIIYIHVQLFFLSGNIFLALRGAHFDPDSGQQHIYARKHLINKCMKIHETLVSQTYIVSVTVGAHFINSVGDDKFLHEKVFPLTYSHV